MRREGLEGRTERTKGGQVGPGSWRPSGGPKRKWTPMTVAVVCGFVVFLALVFTALGFGIRWYNSHSTDATLAGDTPGSRVVNITTGMTASQIGALLQEQGVIANSSDFIDLVTAHGTENKLQPSMYTFTDGLNLADVVDMLEQGSAASRYKVLIPEGLAISQIKARLDEGGKLSGTDYESLTAQAAQFDMPFLAGVQVTGVTTLEGLLFPSTYFMSEGQGPEELIKQQLLAFTNKTGALPWANLTPLGVSSYQIVIIASIIEKECKVPDERAKVAQVIYNRLANDMPLQIDATVRYAVGKWTGALTQADLDAVSPYNTYLNKGLPPAPICNPGEAALRAALTPTAGDWLYYVLKDTTGSHLFTSDYQEFLEAKANQPSQ